MRVTVFVESHTMSRGRFGYKSAGHRSGLETNTAAWLKDKGIQFTYEEDKLLYLIPVSEHTYTPDFKLIKIDGSPMYIETKGYWDAEDRKKHFLLKDQYPDLDLRFVFQNPKGKIRKGSKTTYADVCEGKLRTQKQFIVPYAKSMKGELIPLAWLNEVMKIG